MRSSARVAWLLTLLVAAPAAAQLFGNEEERRRYTGETPPAAAPAPAAAPRPVPAAAPPAPVTAAPQPDPRAEEERIARELEEAKAAAEEAETRRLERLAGYIEELEAHAKEFEAQAREYRGDVQFMIERTYEERRDSLTSQFERAIREIEVSERRERLDAIALFERFIARYPDDEKYTPDAMTRLAELYYEKAVDDQQLALADFEEQLKLGAADAMPPEAGRSFRKSIALYQQIITKFPRYRLIDSIYYLLGWCLAEEGEPEEARAWFQRLIENFPTSRYVPEAWVRIGEYYFDYQGEDVDDKLREAIRAYTQAVRFSDSGLYDKALYKLGWSYYRLNEFQNGVDAFIRLIDHYQSKTKEGEEAGGDLRAEALQYTAISFADDKFGAVAVTREDGSVVEEFRGVEKMADYFRSIGGRPYEHELFRKLGDVLFDSTKYTAAVSAYEQVLRLKPYAPDAPQVQDKIVTAYARDGDRPAAFEARSKLVAMYGEDSEWAKQNQGNQDVLIAARELVERNLLSTAQYHHAQAIEYEKLSADDLVKYGPLMLASYQKAAHAYGQYLKEFPHSKNLYEIQYYLAETLYNSLQFQRAAEVYATVRDSNTDNKYLANAAYYVVLALQKEIDRQESQGLLERREPCDPEKCAEVTDFSPQTIPPLRLELISAADIYMQKIPTAEDAAVLSFKAGQTYFTYFHFDEARRRYEEVIKRFPDKEVAEYAFNDILISYLLAEDWENVEKFAGRMLEESKATQADRKKYEEKRLLKYGARFKRANLLMEQKKWQEAADLYVSIVDDTEKEARTPDEYWENADKALYNAATCYKEYRKFGTAMQTYERLFTNYPKSELAQSALFFVAEAAEKAFEFDKAIQYYMRLYEKYPDSKDRVAALFNASQLLEALQRYKEAAEAYKTYARVFHEEADAPDMAYKAAVIYQRMGDSAGLIDALSAFIRQYQNTESQYEKVVQAHLKIGLARQKQGNDRLAERAFEDAVRYFDQKGLKSDQYLAAQAAGEAAFRLVEKDYDKFKAKKFDPKGRGRRLQQDTERQLVSLANELEELKKRYSSVITRYVWPEWITASLLRLGNADEEFAKKLLESPCPAEIKAELGEEGCFEYKIVLEEQIMPIMDRAILAYETAADKATELRIVNEWTKLAMEKVCEFSPAKCKSLKEPRGNLIVDGHSPLPFMGADGVTPLVPAGDPPPVISDVQPRRLSDAGGTLTVTGEHFGEDPAQVEVSLGSATLLPSEVTSQQIVVSVPAGATSAPLTVKTASGLAATSYEITVEAAALGIGAPSVVPAPAPEGELALPAAPPAEAPPAPPVEAPAAPPVEAPAAGGAP